MELFQKIGTFRPLIFVLVLLFSTKSDGNPITNSKTDYLDSYANLMKSYMNFSVDPCEDFYEYSCGNFKQSSPLLWMIWSNSRGRGDFTNHLAGKTEAFLGRMDLAESLNVSKELKVAQRFYNACLGASLSPFPADDPHYLALIRSIGGFPAVDGANWNASHFSWFNMSAHMTNYGAEGLINEGIYGYPFEPYLYVPEFGFDTPVEKDILLGNSSQTYKLNEERMRGYLRSFKLSEDKISEVIDGVFAFWREAVKVEETFLPGNCEIFENNYFQIVWNGNLPKDPNPRCNSYFVDIDKVCAKYPEAVANYLAMKLLYAFDARLNATQTQQDYCEETMRYTMAFLFNKLLLSEHFTETAKLEVVKVMLELRKTVQKSLDKADWLDSKDPAKKLPKTEPLFDLAEYKLLADRIIPEIGRLEIVDDSYAATNINLQRLTVDIDRFSTRHAQELYNSSRSQHSLLDDVTLLATFFQPPVFDPSWPYSLKFGGLASLLGRFVPKEKFQHQRGYSQGIECFVDYFSKFRILDENQRNGSEVEDFGQLRLSFAAYQSYIEHLLEDPKQEKISEQMPGLDLLPEQLFFLKSTQLLCSASKKEAKYKAVGSLTSNEDFFQAFNCPVGSGMRPVAKTCPLW
ncbi:neprilysin-4-like [Drosophila takahashii]|uniref:neprilysin-4-like n=1 Tax=Drosophila takahashii TaxID=29030 RepID=UPI0038995469